MNDCTNSNLTSGNVMSLDLIKKALKMLRDAPQHDSHLVENVKMTTARFDEFMETVEVVKHTPKGLGMLATIGGIRIIIQDNLPPQIIFIACNRQGDIIEVVKDESPQS